MDDFPWDAMLKKFHSNPVKTNNSRLEPENYYCELRIFGCDKFEISITSINFKIIGIPLRVWLSRFTKLVVSPMGKSRASLSPHSANVRPTKELVSSFRLRSRKGKGVVTPFYRLRPLTSFRGRTRTSKTRFQWCASPNEFVNNFK